MATQEIEESGAEKEQAVYFFSKFWWGIFLASSVLISLVLLVAITYPIGISVRSDVVFGGLALVSGSIANLILQKKFNKKMMVSERLPFSILYVWIPFCIFIMVFRPFE